METRLKIDDRAKENFSSFQAMEIQKHTGDLMNGCTGRKITI
jgi:hypothetical protein